MSRCQTTTDLFSDYYDGGLSAAERQSLEEHLRSCDSCRLEYEQYTRSLRVLHETAPLETTQIFVTSVRTAAQRELERRELYARPGAGTSPAAPQARPGTPGWVPWALTAVTVLAFGAGYLGRPRARDRELEARLVQLEKLLAERPAPPPGAAPPPVDEKAVLGKHGMVEVEGAWLPRKMLRDFEEGKVYLGPSRALAAREAAQELARHLPATPPPPPAPAPGGGTTEEEVLKKYGLVLHEGSVVPRSWLERWAQGDVLVGLNEWRRPSAFREALIREYDLVEKGGRLMSRREAEEIAARQLVRRPAAARAANAVTAALEGLRIGAPVSHGGLTLYPLVAPGPALEVSYTPLHAALGGGKLELSERDSLFSVQARNALDADVFLLAGEILDGGRCDRMVAADTVVPRGKGASVPVLCVEPGVWKSGETRFARESGHYVAPPSLRRALAGGLGQGVVWAILSKSLDKGRAGQVDVFRRHTDRLLEFRDTFSDLADREPGTVGVAVAVGGSVEAAELFPTPAIFRAYADRLVRGAALDALERAADPSWRPVPDFADSVRGVKDFLESAFTCAFDLREGGIDLRREEATVGRAAVSAAGLQHLILFSPGAPAWDRRAAAPVPREKLAKALAEYDARLRDKAAGPLVKAAVLRDLASINAPEVVTVLLGHLGEPDLTVRRAVVRELGACGDPAAVRDLAALLGKSRKEPTVFTEAARALARIGDERAADALLKQVDGGDPEIARIVVSAMPELLLQLRNPAALERCLGRLIDLYASAEAAARGDAAVDPVLRGYGKAEAQALAEAARAALRQATGVDHDRPAPYQKWWNEPASRAKFLRDRTGR